jgi:hypothetical protein
MIKRYIDSDGLDPADITELPLYFQQFLTTRAMGGNLDPILRRHAPLREYWNNGNGDIPNPIVRRPAPTASGPSWFSRFGSWIGGGLLLVLALVILAIILPRNGSTNTANGSSSPTPAPTMAPTTGPAATPVIPAPSATDNGSTVNGGQDVQNPTSGMYDIPPQPEIGHPSFYAETGVPCANLPKGVKCSDTSKNTKTYDWDLVPGTMAVIGGFTVDNISNGVYKVVQSGHVHTTVTNGFVLAVINEWAENEFCFRIWQTITYDWAHDHVSPLSGWTCNGWDFTSNNGRFIGNSANNSGNSGVNGGSTGNSNQGNCAVDYTGVSSTKTYTGGCIAVGYKVWVNDKLMGNHGNPPSSQCWTETPTGSTVKIQNGAYGNLGEGDKSPAKYGHC